LRPTALKPDKLDNRFTPFDSPDNRGQGTHYFGNQAPVIGVADPNPQDHGTIALRRTEKREVSIFGHQDG